MELSLTYLGEGAYPRGSSEEAMDRPGQEESG